MARRWKRKFLGWLFTAVVMLAIVLLAGYLAAVYRPGRYDPRPLSESQALAAEDFAVKLSQDLYNNSYLPQPFTIRLDQRAANDFLLLRDEDPLIQRLAQHAPQTLRKPQVSFSDKSVYVMGEVAAGGVASIITIALEFAAAENGQVRVRLAAVSLGALPVPRTALRGQLPRLERKLTRTQQRSRQYEQNDDIEGQERHLVDDLMMETLPGLAELVRTGQLTVPARFRATKDGRWLRVTQIEVGEGFMTIEITPEED